MDLSKYHLTSRKNGGQWSGPCFYSGIGNDRFTIEPHPRGGKPRWFCRSCSQACGHGWTSSHNPNYRWGYFDDDEKGAAPLVNTPVYRKPASTITPEKAHALAANLNAEGLAYLKSRGVGLDTAQRFAIGMVGGRMITIPLLFHDRGVEVCRAIKTRWLPQYQPPGRPSYNAMEGSQARGIFNFDATKTPATVGIIANSLFDVLLLADLGYPVVGPFAGEASWETRWSRHFSLWPVLINVGDWDAEKERHDGTRYRPGTEYMLKRAVKLVPPITRVFNVYPPGGWTDVSEAYARGEDVRQWLDNLIARIKEVV